MLTVDDFISDNELFKMKLNKANILYLYHALVMHTYTSTDLHECTYTANNENSAGSNRPGHISDVGPCRPDRILCNTQRGYAMSCTAMPHPLPLSGEHQTVLHIQHQNKLPGWSA